jgi:hypothetical protein
MKLSRHPLSLAVLPWIAVSSLLACAAPIQPSPTQLSGQSNFGSLPITNKSVSQIVNELHAKKEQVTVLDVGRGAQTTASVVMKINLTNGRSRLTTQASTGGESNKVSTDITAFEVYLIDNATAPSGVLSAAFSPFTIPVNLTAMAQTVVFTNVRASTGRFYVAVKALEGAANITNLASTSTISGEHVYVSSTGGNGTGGVAVGAAPSYAITEVDQLGISLFLLDALGATIDSNTTVTNGSTAPVDPVSAS